ncbi:hypothetical protein MHC_01900 [Mycoplasma haemocanis str. Illinois]|uniref:Uncharacterized protein n=1 Tax=Mycoplasma haemocanis (strain Illinois) TaxID=1111676 RepID=H6N6H4_MYCHN|nr:hypothetical protein [Mycoplasma haemocanis]AEW45246.1 hypothetical protein MHC_01900 [Mycoplasma haemocanis str. Illinois]
MSYLLKGGLAAATVGATATGVYIGSNYLTNTTSVSKYLTNSGYKLISSIKNPEHIKRQWQEEFKSDKETIKSLLNLKEDDENKGGEELRKWCSSKLESEYSNNFEDLENVKKYCVIKTIKEWLIRDGNKKILTENQGDNSKWEATYNKRKQAKTSRSQVGLTESWPENSGPDKKDADLPVIKNWCREKSNADFLAHEETYSQVKDWCTET